MIGEEDDGKVIEMHEDGTDAMGEAIDRKKGNSSRTAENQNPPGVLSQGYG
jgi:hypothetical protein